MPSGPACSGTSAQTESASGIRPNRSTVGRGAGRARVTRQRYQRRGEVSRMGWSSPCRRHEPSDSRSVSAPSSENGAVALAALPQSHSEDKSAVTGNSDAIPKSNGLETISVNPVWPHGGGSLSRGDRVDDRRSRNCVPSPRGTIASESQGGRLLCRPGTRFTRSVSDPRPILRMSIVEGTQSLVRISAPSFVNAHFPRHRATVTRMVRSERIARRLKPLSPSNLARIASRNRHGTQLEQF